MIFILFSGSIWNSHHLISQSIDRKQEKIVDLSTPRECDVCAYFDLICIYD